jgi:small subunit ribosomal protein S7
MFGKKNIAFKILYDSLEIVGDKFKSEGKLLLRFSSRLRQCHQVEEAAGWWLPSGPMEIRPTGKQTSMKNMICSRKRTGHSMSESLPQAYGSLQT